MALPRNREVTLKDGTKLGAQAASLYGTGTSAPITPVTAYKDIGLTAGTNDTDAISAYDTAISRAKTDAFSKVNEKDIYQDKLNLYQKEIDATNQIYAQKLAEARTQGVSNLGTGRAIQARSGTLGSDFAVSQNADITNQNNAIQNSIQSEQSAKIAAIMGQARKEGADELAAKRAAQQSGLTSYLDYLGKQSERRTSYAKKVAASLLDQDIEFDQADPTQLAGIAKAYRISTNDIKSVYAAEKKTRTEKAEEARLKQIKDNSFSLSEGQSRYQYEPETGTYKLIAEKAKTYAPSTSSSTSSSSITGSNPAFTSQPAYQALTAAQKKQADSLNNLVRELGEYETMYRDNVNGLGTDLVGESAGLLQSKLNSIIFAAAQAEGTGALQAADRAVIEKIVPNPTSLGGAFNSIRTGGKQGAIGQIQGQIVKYSNNLAGLGLRPVLSGQPASMGPSPAAGPDREVSVISPDGVEGTVLESELADYESQGYTPL